MSIVLRQTKTALGPLCTASFSASGGTGPYSYSIVTDDDDYPPAGGSINSSTGIYTAPAVLSTDPERAYDTIRATDALSATAESRILVGSVLALFCEIIQQEMGLPNGRVYLWDQKISQPTDNDLYIAVSVLNAKPFGNVNKQVSTGSSTMDSQQWVNMLAVFGVDLISRGPSARDRKEELILALGSTYAEQQQEANSFLIGRLPTSFVNISQVDGAAIPYRFHIDVQVQYAFAKNKAIDFFDNFEGPEVITDP